MKTAKKTNPKVDDYFVRTKTWQAESKRLRTIILGCHLTEELKWGKPCYSLQDKNVVVIQGFKEYCAIMFFKGALLKDARGLLKTPGNTQAGRQIRFSSLQEIVELESTLKSYLDEAIEVEKSGAKVNLKSTAEYAVPEEFQCKLDEMPELKSAFSALTPGRQRGYLVYFASAKQSKTRESRVEKLIPQILDGKGLDDR